MEIDQLCHHFHINLRTQKILVDDQYNNLKNDDIFSMNNFKNILPHKNYN